jgi:hypothetical protein
MLGIRSKMNAFIALCRLNGATTEQGDELEDFLKNRVIGLNEQRNRAIHDVWRLDNPRKPKRQEATAAKVLRRLSVGVPTEKLVKLASNIEKLTKDFDVLANRIFLSLHPLPDTGPTD